MQQHVNTETDTERDELFFVSIIQDDHLLQAYITLQVIRVNNIKLIQIGLRRRIAW